MKNSQIESKGITVDADQPTYKTLSSVKGSGQVIKMPAAVGGYQMLVTVEGEGYGAFFATKTEAVIALVEKLS
ncbi:MAG TPA: hypothetical protein PKE69_27700 [Pyrinomonadaceae bacterium]|nr:hypothetical protein [Pyrinomonadaceae bacterium]